MCGESWVEWTAVNDPDYGTSEEVRTVWVVKPRRVQFRTVTQFRVRNIRSGAVTSYRLVSHTVGRCPDTILTRG